MSDSGRTPPHDLAAEQVTIGGMLLSADAITDVTGIITPADHYRGAHQIIHEALLRLAEAGEPTDAVAVGAELTKSGELGRVGGGPYLHDLIASVPTAANAGYYARIVREHAIRRRLIEAGTRTVQMGYEADGDAAEVAARALAEVEAAAIPARPDRHRDMAALMSDVVGNLEQRTERGLPTGLADLDRVITGLVPGQFTIVAARPSVGKSVLLAGIASHLTMAHGHPVLLVSLEMSADEIALRLISARARVPLHTLLLREVTEPDWDRIGRHYDDLASSPLLIDDTPEAGLAYIRSQLREMARTAPARLLAVDYLGLLSAPKGERREAEVAALSRGLKLIAREFAIPVVAAAQLNRESERRTDKRPQLSDLRESGAQEQDADVVILLHREDVYEPDSPRAGEIDLIVAKNRQGPKATITAGFQGHYARIVGLAKEDREWSPSSNHPEVTG